MYRPRILELAGNGWPLGPATTGVAHPKRGDAAASQNLRPAACRLMANTARLPTLGAARACLGQPGRLVVPAQDSGASRQQLASKPADMASAPWAVPSEPSNYERVSLRMATTWGQPLGAGECHPLWRRGCGRETGKLSRRGVGAWTPSGSAANKKFCGATWLFSRSSRAIGKTLWPISEDWPQGRVEH